jgi:hypothetical protein
MDMISLLKFSKKILKENLGRCNLCTIHLPSGRISIIETTDTKALAIKFYTSIKPIVHPDSKYSTSNLKQIYLMKEIDTKIDQDLEKIIRKSTKPNDEHIIMINDMVINLIEEYLNDMKMADPCKTKPTYTELKVYISSIVGYLEDPLVAEIRIHMMMRS